jgi:hypothetical protein
VASRINVLEIARMPTMPQDSNVSPERRRIDPALAAIVVGAIVLIIAGLVAIPLASRRAPELAPETAPEGVVQRFYQAVYAGDYTAAHGYLAAETRAQLPELELQQQLAGQLRQSQARVAETTAGTDSATVQVVITHFQPGGLFDSNEWTEQYDVVLKREGDSWKIVSGPFYIPTKP